jgi:hypothetical protein
MPSKLAHLLVLKIRYLAYKKICYMVV